MPILCMFFLSVQGQHNLSRRIEMPKFENVKLRVIFDQLKKEESVLFSFNSNLVDLDKPIHAAPFRGLMIDYLEVLLGEKYTFKETNSHIIITYAPQRLNVHTIDIDTLKNNRAKITGYVMDVQTNKPLDLVTVYDRTTFQAASLTRKNGYFELDLKNLGNTVTVALSKENYRDTMLVLLLPIDVTNPDPNRKVGYHQTLDSTKTIANSAFGRFFTSSKQRIQSLNVGGFFVYSPFQISMTPGLSTHGLFNSQVVNKFSLNIIGGYTAGVSGTEWAGVFNVNQFDMRGGQVAGVTNVVGGDVRGLQMAGVANVGLNTLKGVQLAGVWNTIDTLIVGAQIAGVANLATDATRSLQIAGAMNKSTNEVGNQVAGGINMAKKVRGIQLGVVNIADSSDYPIGVFNWIKNGTRQFSIGLDESQFAALNFKTGGRVLYAVLGAGTYIDDKDLRYGFETGLGGFLVKKKRFSLSAELTHRIQFDKDWKYNEANRSSLRIIPAIRLNKSLQLYAAPSLTYAEATRKEAGANAVLWKFWGADASRKTIHGGGMVGLSYTF
ncbi:carboxypeptidase-like regulatory domain-containing protein [Sphingobacterium sp. SGR-19]|uniref:carboxypeptidase-like regulatory domain-containing protein n=1 Tax=Sphingobacterium sp. SGR-19 TaxID=2710886 RepID=UPI0013EE2E8C|nr:carboxypeptidase-like regulatory domain-containing protein [Sphingobacterium sp. SGR-19]NGM64401.1 carboxypeptidase-like regulatory domain-containing protein [Sphingobacterium sp. SGR-19]